jgi:hypothetical protein
MRRFLKKTQSKLLKRNGRMRSIDVNSLHVVFVVKTSRRQDNDNCFRVNKYAMNHPLGGGTHAITSLAAVVTPSQSFSSSATATLTTSSQVVRAASTSRHDAASFAVTFLERSSLKFLWGISLSLFDGRVLVLGAIATPAIMIRGYWAAPAQATTDLPPYEWPGGASSRFNHYVITQKVVASPDYSQSQGLLPGDVVLSINGRPISAFGSLAQLTLYLRSCHQLSILSFRYKPALDAASQKQRVLSSDFQTVAEAAYHVLGPIFSAPPRQGLFPSLSLPVPAMSVSRVPFQRSFSKTPKGPGKRLSSVPLFQETQVADALDALLQLRYMGRHPATSGRGDQKDPSEFLDLQTFIQTKKSNGSVACRSLTNPLVRSAEDKPYSVNPKAGERVTFFLNPQCRENFPVWLENRKRKWKSIYKKDKIIIQESRRPALASRTPCEHSETVGKMIPTTTWVDPTNPLFRNAEGEPIPYCDNHFEYDPEEDRRAALFLNPHCRENFPAWLENRKRKWRSTYKVYKIEEDWVHEEEHPNHNHESDEQTRRESSVAIDFWTRQEFPSLQHWLQASTAKWKQSYRWNRKKRQRLEQDWDEVVHLSAENWNEWLRVRKNQWRVMRRKRQRERFTEQEQQVAANTISDCSSPLATSKSLMTGLSSPMMPGMSTLELASVAQPELLFIDALLEEQERERLAKDTRPPLDIMALFEAKRGCPDDAVAHCLSFLDAMEHGKFLCISSQTRKALIQREPMWRQLCPSHWTLPQRPRKAWHELYLGTLRSETEKSRKLWDDVLMKVSTILLKGDQLLAIEKIVTKGEKESEFNFDYTSGGKPFLASSFNTAAVFTLLTLI